MSACWSSYPHGAASCALLGSFARAWTVRSLGANLVQFGCCLRPVLDQLLYSFPSEACGGAPAAPFSASAVAPEYVSLFLCWCRLVRMPLRSRIFSCWLRRQPVLASPVASHRLTTILAPKASLGLDCHISIAHVGCFWVCFPLSLHGSQGVSPGARWPFQPQVDISVPSCLGALVGQGDGQERHSASLCRWFWPQMFEIEVHCKPLRGDSGRGSARMQTAPAILSLGRSLSGSAGPVGLGPESLGTVAVSCSESDALVSQGFAGVGLLQSELVAVIPSRP
jgi:hypothetical protein